MPAHPPGRASDAVGFGLGPAVSPASDLLAGPRHVTIVTTAALPWMTGTAVNPLLRAGQLAARGHEVRKRGGGQRAGAEVESYATEGCASEGRASVFPIAAISSLLSPRQVVLVLPFLEEADQARLFKPGTHFERPREQEEAMRTWLDQVRCPRPLCLFTWPCGSVA